MKEATEILRIGKADPLGDFFGRQGTLGKQIASAGQAHFKGILMGAKAGVMSEGAAEPAIAYVKLPGEVREVNVAFGLLADESNGLLDDLEARAVAREL